MRTDMEYAIHPKPQLPDSFERLNLLWEKYPQYHERTVFSSIEQLLEEHESWRKDFDEIKDEYMENGYESFLIQLSWNDLAYRRATAELIEKADVIEINPHVKAFLDQFEGIDPAHKACFLFPESCVSQFFVIMEVCKKAELLKTVNNLFEDEEKIHYLAVFDKKNMDDVLLMFHLLYTNASEDLYGGYSLYDYSLPWYQNHLWKDGIVFRSPWLPDLTAKFQGALPYYHNPAKTVYVRRNIAHILECGYFENELELFVNLTKYIMPFFEWLYRDIALFEDADGYRTDWRLKRTEIRTELTSQGIIKPKWKHELSLFHAVKKLYPDTLYQYRPEFLGRQSLDMYIPSLNTGIEFQGIQHQIPVDFFGGLEALEHRRELDEVKRKLCEENNVRLIEWSYETPPSVSEIRKALK